MHLGTAILSQKADQSGRLAPVQGVKNKPSGAPRAQQARPRERVQMMRQRRTRHLQPTLDVVDAVALRASPHQQAEDLEPVLLPQRAELFDVLVHYVISSIVERYPKCQEAFSMESCQKCVLSLKTEGRQYPVGS